MLCEMECGHPAAIELEGEHFCLRCACVVVDNQERAVHVFERFTDFALRKNIPKAVTEGEQMVEAAKIKLNRMRSANLWFLLLWRTS